MGKYYKGSLIDVRHLPSYLYSIDIVELIPNYKSLYRILRSSDHNAYLFLKKYSGGDLEEFSKLINRIVLSDATDEEKQKIDKIMTSLFKPAPDNVQGKLIIYEKIYDTNGNAYGKEIVSGAIFPLRCKYSDFNVSYRKEEMDEIYYDLDSGESYTLLLGELHDSQGKTHQVPSFARDEIKGICAPFEKSIYFENKSHSFMVCNHPSSFKVCLTPKMIFSDNQRVEFVIGSETIANEIEINRYLAPFENGFGKKRRIDNHKKDMSYYESHNNLGEINHVSDNPSVKELANESNLTKEMQELEFLLFKLKSISKDDYDLLNEEYLELLNQNDNELHLNTLSINAIISLQNRVNLAFMCHGGNSKNIIAYLEEQVNIYLENYNNGLIEKTEISIKDLDKISEYFLNSKNSYTIKEQNEILRCLALLYFFEIYENKDDINSNDLANSYVSNSIKRILIIIDILYTEGVIKVVPNSLYDIKNVDELLDFIKKIEISDSINTKGESLIKRIQQ